MKNYLVLVACCIVIFGCSALAAPAAGKAGSENGAARLANFDDFDVQLAKVWKLYEERKYDEVIRLCEKLAKLRPGDNRPYALSGAAHMGQWKMEEASALFALAIKFSPGNPVLHYNKARADRFRNAKDEGLISVRKAIELRPGYAEAYLLLGELLNIGGTDDYTERIAAFRKSIELKPDLFAAYEQLGMSLGISGDSKGAEEAYRKALEIDPKKEASFFSLGRLLVKQGRLKEARELWDKRPAVKDNTFPNFITVLERAEKHEQAKRKYEANPNDPESILQMGLVTMEGDSWVSDRRQEKAIEFFRRALEIDPNYTKAQHAICVAYVQLAYFFKSNNSELEKEIAKLKTMDPKLAADIVEYRKNYVGGLRTSGPPAPAKKP